MAYISGVDCLQSFGNIFVRIFFPSFDMVLSQKLQDLDD